jgi:hypothetical protein
MLSYVALFGGIAVFVVVWGVSALAIDRWITRRSRRSLRERLEARRPTSVADQAQRWLQEQQR